MRKLFVTGCIALIAGCNRYTEYRNATEFEVAVNSWNLVGLNRNEADTFLAQKCFKCTISTCARQAAHGFVCAQDQEIKLIMDDKWKVKEVQVWKLPDGTLSTTCL